MNAGRKNGSLHMLIFFCLHAPVPPLIEKRRVLKRTPHSIMPLGYVDVAFKRYYLPQRPSIARSQDLIEAEIDRPCF